MADISLLFDVAGGGSVGGESGKLIQEQLTAIVAEINANPLKIKIEADPTSIESMKSQIKSLVGSSKVQANTIQSTTVGMKTNSASQVAQVANEVTRNTKQTSAEVEKLNVRYDRLISKIKAAAQWTASEHGKTSTSYSGIQNQIGILEQARSKFFDTNDIQAYGDSIKKAETNFLKMSTQIKTAHENTKDFYGRFSDLTSKFGLWFGAGRTIMTIWRGFKKMLSIVKQVDDAMTELRKVTNLTEQSYSQFLNTAQKTSQKIGASLADTIKSTSDFARLGYNLSDSSALAEAALVYKNVGDGIDDISEASESLISTIKAFEQFGESAKDAMSIVDRFNEVGNNFAISSEGVGVALQKSASSLAAGNNTLNESIALATAMNAVVQNPETVGTALKTLSMYLRAAKTEAEDAGESTDGMANSVSELRNQLLTLTHGKVDIMIDDSTFKSTYQIMKDLAGVWGTLSDIDTANIVELIGGKRNATAVTSLITNFKDAESAMETMNKASGSALTENEKYLDSISGKLSVLKAKLESISISVIDKGTVDVVLDLVTALTSILELLLKFPLIISSITAASIALNLTKQHQSVSQIANQMLIEKAAIIENKSATDSLITSIAGLNAQQHQLLITTLQAKVANGQLSNEEYKSIISTFGLSLAEQQLTATNKGLAASFKSVTASIPIWGWIAVGISVLIELVPMLVNLFKDTSATISELEEEWVGLSDEIKNTANNFRALKSEADDIIPRYAELAQGVDKYGKNSKLTDEEFSEFISLQNKLADLFPDLVTGYDANGNAILNLSGSYDTLTESLYACLEVQRLLAAETISETMPDVVGNITGRVGKYDQIIGEQKDWLSYGNTAIPQYLDFLRSGKSTDYLYGAKLRKSDGRIILNSSAGVHSKVKLGEFKETLDSLGISSQLIEGKGDTGDSLTILDPDWERKLENYTTTYERNIASTAKKIEDVWSQLHTVIPSWMEVNGTYQSMGSIDQIGGNLQTLTSRLATSINWSDVDFGKKIEDVTDVDIEKYISDNILTPIFDSSGEIQNALSNIFTADVAFDSGNLTAKAYQENLDSLVNTLNESNFSEDTKRLIYLYFDIATDANGVPITRNGMPITNSIQKAVDFLVKRGINEDKAYDVALSLGASQLSFVPESDDFAKQFGFFLESNEDATTEEMAEFIERCWKNANPAQFLSIDFSKAISNLESSSEALVSAFKEMTDDGSLSTDTITSLLEKYPHLIKYMQVENGLIRISSKALEEQYNINKANALEKLNAQKEEIENNIVLLKQDLERLRLSKIATNKDFASVMNAIEDYENSLHNIKLAIDAVSQSTFEAIKAQESYKDSLKNDQEAIEDLIELTMDMIKKQKELEKDALEAELDGYKTKIDKLKEILQLKKEDAEYEKSLNEKKKAVVTIEQDLEILRLDDSIESKKKQLELEEELAEARDELDSLQKDKEIERAENALDAEYDAFEAMQNEKIEAIEDFLSKEGLIRQQAIALINQQSEQLYNDLLEYNRLYGDGIDANITAAWNAAKIAMDKYNTSQWDVLATLESITTKLNNLDGANINVNLNYQDPYTYTPRPGEKRNPNTGGDGYLSLDMYHSGGIVSNIPAAKRDFLTKIVNLQSDEVLAKLKVGEQVLTYQHRNNIAGTLSSLIGLRYISNGASLPAIKMGDIFIQGNADQGVVDQIKKIQKDTVDQVFKRLMTNFRAGGANNQKVYG